jgi:hypothetical protein
MLSVPHLPDSPPEDNVNNMMQIAELPTSFEGTNSGMSPAQPRTPPPICTPTSTPSKGIPSIRSATKRRELHQRRYTPGLGSSTSSSSHQPPKASAQRVRDRRLPTTKTSSVFDRLYKTPTASSKQWTSSAHNRSSQPRKTHMHSASSNLDDKDLQVFSRLHVSGTVANTSKRSPNSTLTVRTSPTKSYSPKSPGVHTPTRSRGGALVYSPRMKPKTKLLYSSRYHPGLGMEDIQPIKLGYNFFQSFCEYEAKKMDARTLAQEMIQAFFKQDFPSGRCVLIYYVVYSDACVGCKVVGLHKLVHTLLTLLICNRHWKLENPQVADRPGEGIVFDVKMGATYSWEGTQRRATAQGVVRFLPEKQQVIMHNYKCDIIRDP